jgi:predicted RNA-binding Zn-ribbon protein involved in translation (DUF1610 family)
MSRKAKRRIHPPSPRTGPQCPACGILNLRADEAHNSSSRYANIWICSDCGIGEALQGFFWKERCYSLNLGSQIKKEFV